MKRPESLEQQPLVNFDFATHSNFGVVFNLDQAKDAFQFVTTSWVLCVDGPVCKWVDTLSRAHDFFKPPTRFECGCGFMALDYPPENGDAYLCHKCHEPMVATDIGELRKKVAKLAAGEL